MLLLRGDLPSTGGHPATSEENLTFLSFPGIDFPLRFNQEAQDVSLVLIKRLFRNGERGGSCPGHYGSKTSTYHMNGSSRFGFAVESLIIRPSVCPWIPRGALIPFPPSPSLSLVLLVLPFFLVTHSKCFTVMPSPLLCAQQSHMRIRWYVLQECTPARHVG